MTHKPLKEDFETFINGDSNDSEWEPLDTSSGDRIVWDAPKIVEGEYLGAETHPNRSGFIDNRLFHRMEVDSIEVDGRRIEVGGKEMGFYGTTVLDRGLQQVEPGDGVRIKYLGEQKLPGGKTLKQFKVAKRAKVKK